MWNFIRQTIYSLKRQYGSLALIIKVSNTKTDYKTGGKTRDAVPYRVPHVIMLPEEMAYEVNKGAVYEKSDTTFLVDLRDLPNGLEIDMDDQIVIESDTYQVIHVETYDNAGMVIQTRHWGGS